MDEYYRVVEQLPEELSRILKTLSPQQAPAVQEIRLRTEQPLQFTIRGRLVPAAQFLPGATLPPVVTGDLLQQSFLKLCDHSVFAYETELRQGYLTIAGGHRVGISGCWHDGYFSVVTSLNLRVARWVTCRIPEQVCDYLQNKGEGLLVAGAPGSGKTTFLRTLMQYLGTENKIVCVVDERGELTAGMHEGLPRAAHLHCDVYTQCTKEAGILMALRCMNPQYIVCDELGTPAEARALEQGLASGVAFLASVHCGTSRELSQKASVSRLIQTGAFPYAVFLDGRENPGTVAEWVKLL